MRRKCFFITLITVLIIVFLDSLGVVLISSELITYAGQTVKIEGKVTSVQIRDEETLKAEVLVKKAGNKTLDTAFGEKILITIEGGDCLPENLYNRNVSFTSKVKRPKAQRNPGGFDYSTYLKSKRIFITGYTSEIEVIGEEQNVFSQFLTSIMEKRFAFENSLPSDSKGIICGILFGETAFLDEDIYKEFQMNGTAHVLAVSGLHVGILYSVYEKMTSGRKDMFTFIILILLLYLYGTLAMWTPSVCRAGLMIILKTFAVIKDLRYDLLTSLSTVALILIIHNPYVVFGAGFQMSFLAIGSISFFYPLMSMKIPSSFATLLSVNGGLALYQIYQFNYFSLSALIANIPVIFFTSLVVPATLLSFTVFALMGPVKPLYVLIDILSSCLLKLNSFTAFGGSLYWEPVSPPLILVVLAYFAAFYLASEYHLILKLRKDSRRDREWMVGIFLIGSVLCGMNYCPVSDSEVVFVDVGQGDCVHIDGGRNDVLVDGGGSVDYNVGENVLRPYLLKNGQWNLDMAVVTHLHTDHYKGIEELSGIFPVKKIISGLKKGDKIKVDDNIYMVTLWPLEISGSGQDENKNCSVFMLYYEGVRILITGDLDEEGEKMMLEEYKGTDVLKADVLKIGHHGSGGSTCQEFLDAVSPEIAVIQVGEGNMYGHPDLKVIERCEKKGIMVYRNDLNGAVGLKIKDGQVAAVHTVIS